MTINNLAIKSSIGIQSSLMNLVLLPPTKTVSNLIPTQHVKRQAQETSIVHITITAAGTVVYTQTATSYSYVASYSTVTGTDSTSYPTNNDTNNNNNSNNNNQSGEGGKGGGGGGGEVNKNAIIGGVIGGVAFIALIGLAFLLMRRSQKRKREQQKNDLIDDDDDSYYRGHQRHASTTMEGGVGAGVTGMTSLPPTPRHLVAPLNHLGEREGDGRESKYYQDEGGYYDDVVTAPYPQQAFYSGNNSVSASDSLPSTAVEPYAAAAGGGGGVFRQVPNEVGYSPVNEERHVPHLKDNITTTIEPPHTRD